MAVAGKGVDAGKKVAGAAVGVVTDPKQAAKDAKKAAKEGAKAAAEAAKQAKEDISVLFKPGEGAYLRSADKRGCTDCLCCLVFIAYWGAMIYVAHFALTTGDVNALIFPRDMNGHSCGLDNSQFGGPDLRRFPRLYFPNPANTELQICTERCPGDGSTGKCNGNVTRDYYLIDGVAGGGAGMSSLTSLVEKKGPDQYESESTCIIKGDCSDGTADMISGSCTVRGSCVDAAGNSTVMGQTAPECLTNADHSQTGNTYIPYEWTAYDWEYFEGDESLVCQPKPMETSPKGTNFPPDSMATALLNSWVAADGPCFVPVIKSKDIVYRCIPQALTEFSDPEALKNNAQAAQVRGPVQGATLGQPGPIHHPLSLRR
eukprot:SAG22_NODE_1104_length_5557_cov_11.548369_3_plen_373_part_00